MENRILNLIERSISYTALNTLTDHKFDVPEGIPIFIAGQVVYSFFEDKKIMDGQEYIFQVLWQVFFDSMIFEDRHKIALDALQVLGALYLKKKIFEN